MQLSSSPSGRLLTGSNALPLPLDPALLEHLIIFFHGGSLSNCDRETFKLLRASIPKIDTYSPGLQTLKIEITWEIDEHQERWGPHHINLCQRGEIHPKALPLVDIRGAHKTCEDFIHLAWAVYEYCVRNGCEIKVLSMDRSAVFNGTWEHDVEAVGYLFPSSNAWNPLGFQDWLSEYVAIHYSLGDVNGSKSRLRLSTWAVLRILSLGFRTRGSLRPWTRLLRGLLCTRSRLLSRRLSLRRRRRSARRGLDFQCCKRSITAASSKAMRYVAQYAHEICFGFPGYFFRWAIGGYLR